MASKRTPIVMGNARFTVYSSGCVRLEFAEGGRFSPYPSILVGQRMPSAGSADVTRKGKSLRIKTDRFELVYRDDGKCFSADNLKIHHSNFKGEPQVWVPGKADRGNFGVIQRSMDNWRWMGGPDRWPVEGILSTDGGHYLDDQGKVYWNTRHDWPEHFDTRIQFDGYFFAYGGDYKGALKDFIKVFGRVPMVPRWTFGFWYSRWYPHTEKEFIALAKRYRKERIPIDVMIIDTDWRGGWGGYDWSRKYFPNPKRALKALHDLGLKTSLNDHPGYDKYDALPENDSHIPKIEKRLGPLPHQGQWACDWSRKEAVRAWKDIVLGPFFDQGMDFWWIDGWLKPPFGNMDSQLWANQQYYDLAEEKTGKRGLILARWGGVGSHRYPVQFSGDTYTDWETLRCQIDYTARSCGLGAVYWSHDIGGFHNREIPEEIFVRWVQFGSLSPVFRTHSAFGVREPWKFSVKAKNIFRKQTQMRYALAPYFYTLAREAHETGTPLIRPLYLEYADDGGASDYRQEYLVGRDMLVIPADGPMPEGATVYRRKAYFPTDTWYGLETGETVTGNANTAIDIPLDLIPVYVRQGAIIPCQQVMPSLGVKVPEEVQFDFYPDHKAKSQFVLYEDDGESKDYEKRRFARTRISGSRTPRAIEFSISAPRGTYKGMPRRRTYVLRSRLEPNDKVAVAEAKVGGKEWKKIRSTTTRKCLAGAVKSGHRFCEVRVSSRNEAVRIRIKLG